MDQKLQELEGIFKMILNAPKSKRSHITIQPIVEENKPQDDGNTLIIQENIDNLKIIQELKMKILELENTVENKNQEILYLNKINYKLKNDEKGLRNTIFKIKGSIRVICRIRPTDKECSIKYDNRNICIEEKVYSLDHIYDVNSTQQDVYEELKPELEAVMEGYNICIFAYGQTGSGKTFTMSGNEHNEGLMFKAMKEFKYIADMLKHQGFSINFTVKYLEVYNETIIDLLTNQTVTISHDAKGITLKNCSSVEYKNIEEALELIKEKSEFRKTGGTNCNSNSSRSHSLFIVSVAIEGNNEVRHGSLCLIDLAGSERLSLSKAENERLKETQFINKSLSTLGNVIVAMKKNEQHIPFRDSKLTHLMQDYLSGKSRISMIVHINPENTNESICSLRFATKASECTLRVANKDVTRYL